MKLGSNPARTGSEGPTASRKTRTGTRRCPGWSQASQPGGNLELGSGKGSGYVEPIPARRVTYKDHNTNIEACKNHNKPACLLILQEIVESIDTYVGCTEKFLHIETPSEIMLACCPRRFGSVRRGSRSRFSDRRNGRRVRVK